MAVRRASRRLSDAVENVTKALSKLAERQLDPEEDPEFLARNPTWEDQLPLARGVSAPHTLDADVDKAKTTAALIAALDTVPRPANETPARQSWKKAYKAVKRLMIMRRKERHSAVGTGARVEGYSLGIWGPYSSIRLKLFTFLYNQNSEYVLIFLIGSHLLVLIFQAESGNKTHRWTEHRNFTLDFLDGFITMLYTIEMGLRIVCLGLYKEPDAYLRNPYNRLDFVVVIDSWMHIIVRSATGHDYFARIAVFRAFRGLLALKHINFFADVVAIMAAVKRSVVPLQNVILLTFFLLIFYALLGTQFLQNTMKSRCVRTGGRLAYPPRFCDKKVVDGYICPSGQSCKVYGNPNWGSTSFDIFYFSLLTMFQIVSVEGWSLIMYSVKDAEGERANSYFMTLVVIGTYFLFNVFIAGISGVFLRVRAEHRALLKKSMSKQTSFYSATVMANILRDEIIKDDSQLSWYERLFQKTNRVRKDVARSLSRTHTSMKAMFHSQSSRFNRMASSRSMSRSMSMGVKAALTIHEKARGIAEHPRFTGAVLLAVTINVIVLSLEYYGMSEELHYILRGLQGFLLVIFGVELVLRFLAYGPGLFIADKMNLVDILVVAVSAPAVISGAYPNISSVRCLRWFWYSKRHVDKRPSIVTTCMKSVGSLVGVFFFYLFVIILISIISMELFSGQYYSFPDGYPRANHDTMMQTMLLWFSVTTTENWPNQMWNSMRPGVVYNGVAAFIYVFYLVLTTHIIMNLIIAILLERTELTDNEKKQIQKVEHMRFMSRMQSRAYTRSASWVVGAVEGFKAGLGNLGVLGMNVKRVKSQKKEAQQRKRRERREDNITDSQLPGQVEAGIARTESGATARGNTVQVKRPSQILQATGFTAEIAERRGSRTVLQDAVLALAVESAPPPPPPLQKPPSRSASWGRSLSRKALSRKSSSRKESFELADYEELEKHLTTMARPWYLREGSLLLFGENHRLRRLCLSIIASKYYWWFTMVFTVISVWLVTERQANGEPIESKHFPQLLIVILDYAVFVVFAVDFVVNTVALGFIFAPDAVMSDWYGFLDLFILVIDGVHLIPWKENSLRAIDALLSFRPFRFIVRLHGLRTLLSNLVSTLPAIVSVLFFTFSILLIFATIGVQKFKGQLWYCSDPSVTHRAYCTGLYYGDSSILTPRVWTNQVFHFDDIGNALLSLFICSTFDSWLSYWMYPVMDIVGLDHQPVRNRSPTNGLFFVAFCCVGGFFIVRVFIGVFIDEFGRTSGAKLLTERQKLWRDMNRIIQKTRPVALSRPSKNYIRKFCFYLIRHPGYKTTMIVALLGYSGFLATNKSGQPSNVSNRRQKAHVAITSYFLLESITKLLGDEWRVYKYEHAKHLEFMISIMAAIGLMGVKGTIRGYVGRTAYISRVFCILPNIPKARVIMRTMIICFPKVAEIMSLLAIFLFLFAGIGFQMFSQVAFGNCINPTVNFLTFVNSFITVFQVTTLDNWSCIMSDVMVAPPMCSNGGSMFTNDCGYPVAGVIYFVLLVVVASYIFMNLFVAVILDAITFGIMNEKSMVSPEHLQAFRALWSQMEYDPDSLQGDWIHRNAQVAQICGLPRNTFGAASQFSDCMVREDRIRSPQLPGSKEGDSFQGAIGNAHAVQDRTHGSSSVATY